MSLLTRAERKIHGCEKEPARESSHLLTFQGRSRCGVIGDRRFVIAASGKMVVEKDSLQ
jgi:hypothetical protein